MSNKLAAKICLIDPLFTKYGSSSEVTPIARNGCVAAYLEREGLQHQRLRRHVADHPWRDLHTYLFA
jgi:hypothetical protein